MSGLRQNADGLAVSLIALMLPLRLAAKQSRSDGTRAPGANKNDPAAMLWLIVAVVTDVRGLQDDVEVVLGPASARALVRRRIGSLARQIGVSSDGIVRRNIGRRRLAMPDRRLLLSARELAGRQRRKRQTEGRGCQRFEYHLGLSPGFQAEEIISANSTRLVAQASMVFRCVSAPHNVLGDIVSRRIGARYLSGRRALENT
jgi:hypothetical protein